MCVIQLEPVLSQFQLLGNFEMLYKKWLDNTRFYSNADTHDDHDFVLTLSIACPSLILCRAVGEYRSSLL